MPWGWNVWSPKRVAQFNTDQEMWTNTYRFVFNCDVETDLLVQFIGQSSDRQLVKCYYSVGSNDYAVLQVREFYRANKGKFSFAERKIEQELEGLELRVGWHNRSYGTVASWLQDHQGGHKVKREWQRCLQSTTSDDGSDFMLRASFGTGECFVFLCS